MWTLLTRGGGLVALFLIGVALPAAAQPVPEGAITLGFYSPSAPQPFLGAAFGFTSGSHALEVEYAGTGTNSDCSAASITLHLLIQTPLTIGRARIYGTAGLGMYGETYGGGHGSGELSAIVVGSGAKLPLAGPLNLRWDYRVFLVRREASDPRHGAAPPQRLAVGFSFGF
jgi:hypothetical protein